MINKKDQLINFLILFLGGTALVFVGWKWNIIIAPWIASVLLVRYFRQTKRWVTTLVAIPFLSAATFVTLYGGWDMPLVAGIGFSFLKIIPLIIALYLDRILYPRYMGISSTLIFPVSNVVLDYIFSFLFTGLGAVFSWAPTQFSFPDLSQIASLTGIWGIVFIITWTASVANTVWEYKTDVNKWGKQVITAGIVVLCVLGYGGIRTAVINRDIETVRIGSVTVEHIRNYWDLIIDRNTPEADASRFKPELGMMEDRLFEKSVQAVKGGAKIVFWSEANAVIYEDQEETFLSRAKDFAAAHQVYFMPAYMVARYGEIFNDNKLVMIDPQGNIGFEYLKTMSWYPTESDGIIHSLGTPYGNLSGVICFDLDFPDFVRQAGSINVDILLVPGYDTGLISPYHTEAGMFRAIENGFSIVRQVNEGTSMAVDSTGCVLSLQDYFRTEDKVMYSDVPVKGNPTLYRYLGDWFPILAVPFLLFFILFPIFRKSK